MRLTDFSDLREIIDDNAETHPSDQAQQANSDCYKEISVGSTQPSGLQTHRRTALQVLFAAAVLFTASAGSQWLAARSDEGDAAALGVLPRPRDMSAETLDAAGPEFAARVETLWNTQTAVEERRKALTELQTLTTALPAEGPQATLRQRLLRRLSLLSATMDAAAVANLQTSSTDYSAQLQSDAATLVAALNTTPNGRLWVDYLALNGLTRTADSETPAKLSTFLARISAMDEMSAEQQGFLLSSEVQDLKAAAESALYHSRTFASDDEARQELQLQLDHLLRGLLQNETTPAVAAADRARNAWRAIRARFPAAADGLRPVLNEHYLNNNLHITLSETLIARLISNSRTESGKVADTILGAWVTGTQTTSAQITVDVIPSPNTASFALKLNGNTKSSTVAQKSPATVWTSGDHYFQVQKNVVFDGSKIALSASAFDVDTNSRTTGFRTRYDDMPLFGGIARNMAEQKIADSKAQSDAETARRMRRDIVPKFDQEVGGRFTGINDDLQKTLTALKAKNAAPDNISARSSGSHIAVSSRTIGSGRLGGSTQPVLPLPDEGGALQIHESVLNNALDALRLHGKVVPDDQLTAELEKALSELLQREVKLSKPAAPADAPADAQATAAPAEPADAADEPEKSTAFIFSKADPLRVRFDNGELTLLIQAGIRQEGKADLPVHTIVVPIAISLADSKVVMTPRPVRVLSAPITVANQLRKVIGRRIKARESDAVMQLQSDPEKQVSVTITRIELNDGWLTTEFR